MRVPVIISSIPVYLTVIFRAVALREQALSNPPPFLAASSTPPSSSTASPAPPKLSTTLKPKPTLGKKDQKTLLKGIVKKKGAKSVSKPEASAVGVTNKRSADTGGQESVHGGNAGDLGSVKAPKRQRTSGGLET